MNLIIGILAIAAIVIVSFILLRNGIAWYTKRNEQLKLAKEQILMQEKTLINQKEGLKELNETLKTLISKLN